MTKQAVLQSRTSDNHAYALIGGYGAGKGYLASIMTRQWLEAENTIKNVKHIDLGDKAIGIDDIRKIQLFLKLKVTGGANVKRVIIIENAQNMTLEAQNALLKTLEEPPEDTRIILTATEVTALRPTILSRLQVIYVKPCSLEQLTQFLETEQFKYSPKKIEKSYLISGGNISLCFALLNDTEHPLIKAIDLAKKYITSAPYDRLLMVDSLSRDKQALSMFLFALKRVVFSILHSPKSNITQLTKFLESAYQFEKILSHNPNLKLALTNLALSL